MSVPQDLAIEQLKHEKGDWRRAVKILRDVASSLDSPYWRVQYRRAAAQILRWRREAVQHLTRPNPLSARATAILRREYLRQLGEGLPQRAAWELAVRLARRRGLVE